MGLFRRDKTVLPDAASALPGRAAKMQIPEHHAVLKNPLQPPWPAGVQTVLFGMGCFWGAERLFWQVPGVYSTAVGYAAGLTPNPTYEEVCSGLTGHNEVVLVAFDPAKVGFEQLLKVFWEGHDPTQGMRQGNDVGTQYRSGIYTDHAELEDLARRSRDAYQRALQGGGRGPVTTEIERAVAFYYAEPYHQQYLHKNPGGYCGLGGTGIACPAIDAG